jgi:hypothetical protein
MYADGGVLSGWSCETSDRAYGLNDPSLEGIFGSIFKVVKAPFKAGATVVKTAVKTAVRVAPRTVAGFLAAGPAGAIAGGASALVSRGGQPTAQYTATPILSQGYYPRSDPAYNPYGVTAQPYPVAQYQQPYQPPSRSVGDQVASMFNLLKDELLAAGARKIADTSAGRAAIQEKITGDIGRYILPISIGAGALVLVLAMTRRN